MRKTVFLTLFAAATFLAPASASAVPGAFGDQAAISRDLGATVLEGVAYRAKAKHKRYAKKYPRRYDWSYYPYWRPYQYRYWKFYYPYGGPLF
jgi:hypothetical protein